MSNTFDNPDQYDESDPEQYSTNRDLYGTQNPAGRPEQQSSNAPERQREKQSNLPDQSEQQSEDEEEGMDPYDTENQFTQGGQGGRGSLGSTQEDYGNEGGSAQPDSDRDRYDTRGSQDQYGYQQ